MFGILAVVIIICIALVILCIALAKSKSPYDKSIDDEMQFRAVKEIGKEDEFRR